MKLKAVKCWSKEVRHSRGGATLPSTGSRWNLSNYITGCRLHGDGGRCLECSRTRFMESLSWALKHGPATQGTQKMRGGAALAPAPLTLPTSRSSTGLSLYPRRALAAPRSLAGPTTTPSWAAPRALSPSLFSSEFQPSVLEACPVVPSHS